MQLSSPKVKQPKRLGFARGKPKATMELNNENQRSQSPDPGRVDLGFQNLERRPGQTFIQFLDENKINYADMRRLNRQPVRYNDPGLVWDSFELPKEFAGEELPPLPPTPVPADYNISNQMPSRKNNKLPIDKVKTLDFMKGLAAKMQEDAETRKRELEKLGFSATEDITEEGNGSDLDGSFIVDYSPSPIPTTERLKRFNSVTVEGDEGTPSKKPKTSTPHADNHGNQTELCTPRSRRPSRQNSSLDSSTDTESQLVRRTRLSFDETVVPCSEEELWSDDDDEILSQINLNDIEISSGGVSRSSQTLNGVTVHGEGFEDSDPSEDLLFSQLNY